MVGLDADIDLTYHIFIYPTLFDVLIEKKSSLTLFTCVELRAIEPGSRFFLTKDYL